MSATVQIEHVPERVGRIVIRFAGGEEREFASRSALTDWLKIDEAEIAAKLAIRAALGLNNALDNDTLYRRRCTFDATNQTLTIGATL